METFLYILFSTIEAFAVFITMLHGFRFGITLYFRPIIVASCIFALLSYALREEAHFANYFPIISVLYYSLFPFYVLNTPLVWSLIMSSITAVFVFTLQSVILLVMVNSGMVNMSDWSEQGVHARILQLLFALITIPGSWYLYKRGLGFAFNFDRFRWKADNIVMLLISLSLFACIIISFLNKNIIFVFLITIIMLFIVIYLAIRKERRDLD